MRRAAWAACIRLAKKAGHETVLKRSEEGCMPGCSSCVPHFPSIYLEPALLKVLVHVAPH